ncbi:MAG TPA: flagellar biosynthesis protein FliQ [bacterium]|nr:flagellar biosynthesis protein FliQ [bacterium]
MNLDFVVDLARQGMLIAFLIAAPMLGFGLLVGLIISVFQAVTQINEMTLTFIPKIIAVAVAFALFFPWIVSLLVDFTIRLIQMFPDVAL